MLFDTKLTFLIMSVVLMALLGGTASAQPTGQNNDLGTNFTAMTRAASWALAPEECSRDNLHCLVVEGDGFGGWKNLYCGVSWEKQWGIFKVFAFNRGCSGQIIMNCPEQKTHKVQRGLTWFQFGSSSFFSTTDENVKGEPSDGRPFGASPASYNNLHVNTPWADFLLECSWSP